VTRFDADDPTDRRALFVEAIRAHRTRSSPFLTVEAEPRTGDGDEGGRSHGGPDEEGSEADAGDVLSGTVEDMDDDEPGTPPWVQFSDRESLLNLDCTDPELDRLKELVDDYPSFRIDELTRPEDAEGTNARVSARADPNRIAEFVDETFRRVYGRPPDYRAWVVRI